MELLKLLNLNEVIVQVVNFCLVLFFLKIFLWKRVLKVLDDRKERIASEFKNIEAVKQEVAGMKAGYEAKMAAVETETHRRIQESVETARQEADEIRDRAQQEARKILEDTKESIREEHLKAKQEMRKEIVELTVLAAENLIEEKFTEVQDRKLIENFLKKINTVP